MIADSSSVAGDMLAVVLVYSALYFVPTIVAVVRKVSIPDIIFVFAINLVGGWTGLGWLVALVMAARAVPRERHGVNTPPLPPPPPPLQR
jgi:O-antigen ligase